MVRCSICGTELGTSINCPNVSRVDHNVPINSPQSSFHPLTYNNGTEALVVLKHIRDLLEVLAEKAGWNGHYFDDK